MNVRTFGRGLTSSKTGPRQWVEEAKQLTVPFSGSGGSKRVPANLFVPGGWRLHPTYPVDKPAVALRPSAIFKSSDHLRKKSAGARLPAPRPSPLSLFGSRDRGPESAEGATDSRRAGV